MFSSLDGHLGHGTQAGGPFQYLHAPHATRGRKWKPQWQRQVSVREAVLKSAIRQLLDTDQPGR